MSAHSTHKQPALDSIDALQHRRMPTPHGQPYADALEDAEPGPQGTGSTSAGAPPTSEVTAKTTHMAGSPTLATLRLKGIEESDQAVAFQQYWDLKEGRNFTELSRILNLPKDLLQAWSVKYGWEAEIKAREDMSMLERNNERSLYDVIKLNNELIVSLQQRLEKHREVMEEPDPKKRAEMRDFLLSANDYVRITKMLMEVKGAVAGAIPRKPGIAAIIIDPVEAQKRIDAYSKRVNTPVAEP